MPQYKLWAFFHEEHGLILHSSELDDIVEEVKKYLENTEEDQD